MIPQSGLPKLSAPSTLTQKTGVLSQGRPWFAYARVGYLGPNYDPGQNGVLIWALPLVGFSDVGVKVEADEEKKEIRIKSIRMTWKYGTEVLVGVAGYRNMPVTIVYGVY